MNRPVTSIVLALISVILSPILLMIELSALILAAMINYEPANSLLVKVLSIVVVFILGLLALSTPVIAIISGTKARAAVRSEPNGRAGLATAAVVIGSIVTAGVVAAQIYMILMAAGGCSFEGC